MSFIKRTPNMQGKNDVYTIDKHDVYTIDKHDVYTIDKHDVSTNDRDNKYKNGIPCIYGVFLMKAINVFWVYYSWFLLVLICILFCYFIFYISFLLHFAQLDCKFLV